MDNMNILLCGDIHGDWIDLQNILQKNRGIIIVLGDVGIGFPTLDKNKSSITRTNFECDPNKLKWIRGNHDNPEMCQSHINYLGDFGIFKDIFFVSGAYSIDREFRTEGVDWWADEELSIEKGYKVLDLYSKTKPNIVISHDCPQSILKYIHHQVISTRTGQLLDELLNIHKPKYWYFAHHHLSWEDNINNTFLKCLNSKEVLCI